MVPWALPALVAFFAAVARADDATTAEAELDTAVAEALGSAQAIEDELVRAVGKVRRSSVTVLNEREFKPKGAAESELRQAGAGSGVLVSMSGKTWILTNVHVIAGADALFILTPDRVRRRVVLKDQIATYDIALLEFPEGAPRGLSAVQVKASTSERGIREGTWVIATGNPFGLAEDGVSVTTLGVVSGTGRYLDGGFKYVNAVQHDAEVNPGNSGGPCWNLKGELVGLNGMITLQPMFPGARPTNTGAAFALPASQLDAYLRDLTRKRDAQDAYLGITVETYTDDKGKAAGARITKIEGNSPLRLGRDALDVGDVIMSFGTGAGSRVYTAVDLETTLSVLKAGDRITVTYRRDKKRGSWKGVLGGGGR